MNVGEDGVYEEDPLISAAQTSLWAFLGGLSLVTSFLIFFSTTAHIAWIGLLLIFGPGHRLRGVVVYVPFPFPTKDQLFPLYLLHNLTAKALHEMDPTEGITTQVPVAAMPSTGQADFTDSPRQGF